MEKNKAPQRKSGDAPPVRALISSAQLAKLLQNEHLFCDSSAAPPLIGRRGTVGTSLPRTEGLCSGERLRAQQVTGREEVMLS